MKQYEWKDVTSFSRDQTDRTPTAFEVSLEDLRITITSAHRDYPGTWVMHCHALQIDTQVLKATTLNEAKRAAVQVVKDTLNKLLVDVKKVYLP
jgi:hypothetical protein